MHWAQLPSLFLQESSSALERQIYGNKKWQYFSQWKTFCCFHNLDATFCRTKTFTEWAWYAINILSIWIYVRIMQKTPRTQDVGWTYIRRSEDAPSVWYTSNLRPVSRGNSQLNYNASQLAGFYIIQVYNERCFRTDYIYIYIYIYI